MPVVYLDPYHLGDPLFLSGLARDVAARGAGLVLVHGSGERGERALEALGRFPVAEDGVWDTEDTEGAEAVERAMRELNREIVHELNEQGVASIRATGADRGLLKVRDGRVEAGRAGWLGDLVRQGVVVVVASLVEHAGAPAEVDAATATAVLADALGAEAQALSIRAVDARLRLDALDGVVPDPSAIRRMAAAGATVWVGPRTGLRTEEGVSGLLVES